MKRVILIFIFSFTLCKLSAGADELTWYEGSVVLETREVLVGEISLEVMYDLILFRSNNQITLYRSHRIQSLQFFDAEANINRKFISVWETNGIIRQCHFFESVVKGEVGVLRREKVLIKPTSERDFNYYVQHNDEMFSLYAFRNKVYPSMVVKGGSRLSAFVLDNNLDPNKSANAIEIVIYYNKLVKDDQAMARN